MTINDILTKVDELKPNQYDDAIKIGWLSTLEYRVKNDIYDTHEYNDGETEVTFSGYTEDDINEDVLTPDAYCDIYIYYLFSMIDLMNGETDRYQASMLMFNSAWSAWANYYNSLHMPIGIKLKLF